MKRCLIYGFGNPGRQDDGLGIVFSEILEKKFPDLDFECNYQLNIEDAHTISEYEFVLFADASIEEIEDVKISRVVPSSQTEFTMHAMLPQFILHLCQTLYDKFPMTYLMSIKGYEFEFGVKMTKDAKNNLLKALSFTEELFNNKLTAAEFSNYLEQKIEIV